jgi:diaminopimelate decarboxylase
MELIGTMRINERGHLEIGGCDTIELAGQYGTPLIIYDVERIRDRARRFQEAFQQLGARGKVSYASKAFSSIAMVQLAEELGLNLEVVSAGELYTALKAGFPPKNIHFHGNNKSREEMEMALEAGIGCFVVDNFHELEVLSRLCRTRHRRQPVLLRITPGIQAHTHEYISTGQEDSKFGFDLETSADRALGEALATPELEVLGIHCHIGSQIFEIEAYLMAIRKIFKKLLDWKETYHFEPAIMNLGGGFGIRYTEEDRPKDPEDYVAAMVSEVRKQAEFYGIKEPAIWIEPGRALVGDAGTTLYTIGSRKEIPGVRTYVAVDGGMSDNIRPALYQAKYKGALANRMTDPPEELVSIAGKACESGDMLIWDIFLPRTAPGDVLAVFCTGAYGYSMASNYNRLARPAVLFAENGKVDLIIRRESLEDLIRLDLPWRKEVTKVPNPRNE